MPKDNVKNILIVDKSKSKNTPNSSVLGAHCKITKKLLIMGSLPSGFYIFITVSMQYETFQDFEEIVTIMITNCIELKNHSGQEAIKLQSGLID